MKNNYLVIAKVFKKRRVEMNLSKRKLASLVNISDTEVSRIENGERENYNIVTLIKICDVLDIDFIKLLYAAGYLPQKRRIERKTHSFFNRKKKESESNPLDQDSIYIILDLGEEDD